jgi:Cellulase (glycosyl hydrolase family 5)
MKFRGLLLVVGLFAAVTSMAQKTKDVFVDKNGVMRWGDSKKEVYGFGINYTVPFAHAYRSAKKMGVDLEKEIDKDVYHFARLGFDAFRVHVWDTEISDSLGNLLENEHLRLFDYMLLKMKERGMKIFLTPIAFWGNGYPEPDEKTPGFSAKYGKDNCLTNPDAIKAQQNYLSQFVRHVNPYTKVAYKDDPDIVAFEISNEPHHRETPEKVREFINGMSAAIRKTGCRKPVFYNVSHSVQLGKAYFTSDIDGGTFQWYPTGLGARHELRGNFLPNVDKYTMPFNDIKEFKSQAKIVYEFDAADVGRSYIYPAMARSFRQAGIQWATHFAYDPTFMAYANTEYNTHFMNLVYAPQKALSLKLASEVFHSIPRYKQFPSYPQNTSFDGFRVSYEKDLAELVTEKKFIYTNHTESKPVKPESIEEISGWGNSTLVKYRGTGAYLLDKVSDGVWRLEVMPDAVWVGNLFGRNSLAKEVAVVNWRAWPMSVRLPNLGEDFSIRALKGKSGAEVADKDSFEISPGVYLLARKGISSLPKDDQQWKNIRLNEFVAPETTVRKTYVIHAPEKQVTAGRPVTISVTVVTKEAPEQVTLHYGMTYPSEVAFMKTNNAYQYSFTVDGASVKEGFLNYYITVKNGDKSYTYPAGREGSPYDWDFYDNKPYSVAVVRPGTPLYLFNASTDSEEMSRQWRRGSGLIPGETPGNAKLEVNIEKLFVADPENVNARPIYDYSLRYNFQPDIHGRMEELASFSRIVFKGKSVDRAMPMRVAIIDRNGNTFGAMIELSPDTDEYTINIGDLKPVKQTILPRPYPTFLPYYFENGSTSPFDINLAETLQLSIGDKLENEAGPFRFVIESVRLEK